MSELHDGYEAARKRCIELLDEKVVMLQELDSLRRQLAEVEQQRDGLVKVLKRLPKVNKDIYIGESKISYAQEVQAAITKLGAGETAHNAELCGSPKRSVGESERAPGYAGHKTGEKK